LQCIAVTTYPDSLYFANVWSRKISTEFDNCKDVLVFAYPDIRYIFVNIRMHQCYLLGLPFDIVILRG